MKRTNEAKKETVEIASGWQGMVGVYLALLEAGDSKGRAKAKAEIMRMARVADMVPGITDVLEDVAIRFPIEMKTTPESCSCLQFEDNLKCRHVNAVKLVAKLRAHEKA